MREQMDGAVRRILEEGMARGDLRPLDPHATHLSLIGSLVMYRLTAPARRTYLRAGAAPGPVPTWTEYVDHVRQLFARGLRPTDDLEPTKHHETRPPPTGGP